MDIFAIILGLIIIFLYISAIGNLNYYSKKLKESKEREKDKPKIIG